MRARVEERKIFEGFSERERERESEEKKRCELLTVVRNLLSVEEVEPSTVLDIYCVVQGVYGRRAVEALT